MLRLWSGKHLIVPHTHSASLLFSPRIPPSRTRRPSTSESVRCRRAANFTTSNAHDKTNSPNSSEVRLLYLCCSVSWCRCVDLILLVIALVLVVCTWHSAVLLLTKRYTCCVSGSDTFRCPLHYCSVCGTSGDSKAMIHCQVCVCSSVMCCLRGCSVFVWCVCWRVGFFGP